MTYKISSFMIGVLLIGVIVAAVGLLYANVAENYGVTYDNSTIEVLNEMESIQNISKEIEDRHSGDTSNSEWYDVLGNLVKDGIDTVRLGGNSYTAFMTIKDKAAEKLGLNSIYTRAIFIIIIILIFIAVVLRVKVGADV